MTMTITFGWWLLPMAITVVSCGVTFREAMKPDPYFGTIGHFTNGFILGGASSIVSMIAWLIWAVLT